MARMQRNAWALLALLSALGTSLASADDTQWHVLIEAFRDQVGGPVRSAECHFGVQPGATEGYDYLIDELAPPHPPQEWIDAVWLRPTWDPWERFAGDWRQQLADDETRVWPDLIVDSSAPCVAVLTWNMNGPGWDVPGDYVLILYDEGNAPDPGGGLPIPMTAPAGQYWFSHSGTQRRYFHVFVRNPIGMPPRCDITYSPSVPTRADVINFDSHAEDSDGTVVSVAWEFGDGSAGTGITASHQYSEVGAYLACATVTDNDDNIASCCASVEVINAVPTCTFTYTPEQPVCTDTIDFVGQGADPDGTVTGYVWDFGDGSGGQGQAVSHQYAVGADFPVICTVTDNDGATGTCIQTVVVVGTPPQACFTEDKHAANLGEPIYFDASCTPDPCATILGYEWDFGDGRSATGVTTDHAYLDSGTYAVSLTVYDIDGRSDTHYETKTVYPQVCLTLPGPRWHMMALPCQAADPDPWQVLDELRPPGQDIDLLSGNLHRYDHAGQRYVTYNSLTPSEFGAVVSGDGYWLYLFDDATICYGAACAAAPTTLYFETAGWYLFGSPRPLDVPVADCTVCHDGHCLPFAEAANQWVQDPVIYYDGTGYKNCGVSPQDQDDHFRAFRGYWLYTFVDDVALTLP